MGDSRYLPKNVITNFIEIYKEHPALWKIKSKEYTNRNLKNVGYDALIKIVKDFEPSANRDWVSKKIQSLRGAFRKELKKIELSQRSGASPDDIYVPTLWYFELLQFTMDQEQPQESIDNIKSPITHESDENDDEINMESQDNESEQCIQSKEKYTPPEAQKSRKRKNVEKEETHSFFKACTSALARENDEFEAVGANVAAKLKRMDPAQQVYAELLIQKTLAKGLLRKLSENTDISENRPWTIITPTSMTSPTMPNTTTSPQNYESSYPNVREYYEDNDGFLNNDA